MAQVAYDLDYFTPRQETKKKPRLRVAKRERSARQAQVLKMLRTLVGVLVLVGMVVAVLNTQAAVTEVQSDIAARKTELKEEQALNTYLNFELDNMSSIKNIEERAAQMGLVKMEGSQIGYFRVEDGTNIEVKQSPFAQLWSNTKNGLMSILDFITP